MVAGGVGGRGREVGGEAAYAEAKRPNLAPTQRLERAGKIVSSVTRGVSASSKRSGRGRRV